MKNLKYVVLGVAISLLILPTYAGASSLYGFIQNHHIASNAITSGKIKNRTIQTEDIARYSIIPNKIAMGAVTSLGIRDGTIEGSDIADYAITKKQIYTKGLSADKVDGRHGWQLAPRYHKHDNRYYTVAEVDDLLGFVVDLMLDTHYGTLSLSEKAAAKKELGVLMEKALD